MVKATAFDEEGSWSFDSVFARNVVIFGVDNSSSYHTDHKKNIIFSKANAKFF